MQSASVSAIQNTILEWFSQQGRVLPWRQLLASETSEWRQDTQRFLLRDPYRIIVSELMLQQTQVPRVIPKYEAFLLAWPNFAALAKASQAEVVIAWQGLGYNRRAKYLWVIASMVMTQWGGVFPHAPEDIAALPGIGPYTLAAIRVFAFGEQDIVIDTNVRRVITRLLSGKDAISEQEVKDLATMLLPSEVADTWHQAVMDFGSLICTATSPACDTCPVRSSCAANIQAQKAGFDTYRSYLATQKTTNTQSGKDRGLRFEETDRYFRGRVIDCLRSGAISIKTLEHLLAFTYGLRDPSRFGRIIESLEKEKLISLTAETARLFEKE